MAMSKYLPTFPQSLRILRFLFALIVAGVLGSSFKTEGIWNSASIRSSQFMMFTAVATMLYDCYAFFTGVDAKVHDCTVSKTYKMGHSIAEGVVAMFWWAGLAGVITALEGWIKLHTELHNASGVAKGAATTTNSSIGNEIEWGRGKVVGSLALAGMVGAISMIIWINTSYRAIRI